MIFPRRVRSEDSYADCLRFFQTCLRPEGLLRLEDEYPLVFRPEHIEQVLIKEHQGKIVAGLGTLTRVIEIQAQRFAKVLFVGSVVTDPAHRNQGYQRELFHALDEIAEKDNIDLILLWSSQIGFYQKLDFFLGGLQATWSVTNQATLGPARSMVRVVDSGTLPLEKAWYEAFIRKSHIVRRTEEEMSQLWQIPKMKMAMTDQAYALLGKGDDFAGVCHEWAGPADEVLACIEALRLIEPKLRILSPGVIHTDEERAVVHRFEELSYECRLEYLGLIKALNPAMSEKDFDPAALMYPFFVWGLDSI